MTGKRPRPKFTWKRLLLCVAIAVVVVGLMGLACWAVMIRMPGSSYAGPIADLSGAQTTVRDQLRSDVEHLATTIGERNLRRYPSLVSARDFLIDRFRQLGYSVARQDFDVKSMLCTNIEVELKGMQSPDEIVIVGAHYDSALNTPGANDNATGVAALLALAEALKNTKPAKTLRFVAFVNEEPPHFQRESMGSWHYASRCRQRGEKIVAMLSLETLGCYFDASGTQEYPYPFSAMYPSEGNFVAIIGNVGSRALVRQVVATFRAHTRFPSEGAAVPGTIEGVGWSDHWSFWQAGYPGVMLTDTAIFRYRHYHLPTDTPDKVNFDRLAVVVDGIAAVVAELAGIQVAEQP